MEINKSKYFTNFSLTMKNWMKITICRIGQYSNFFSNCCDKAHDRRSLRREGCVYLCSHFVGKACQQQHKVAGHIDFTIRKQREINAGAQLHFFLFSLGTKSMNVLSTVKCHLEHPQGTFRDVCPW